MMRYYFLPTLLLLLVQCGADNSATKDFSITGSLNGEPIDIQQGICESQTFPDKTILVLIGRNRTVPQGLILQFRTLETVKVGEYTIPHPDLIAGYDLATTASSGTVSISNVVTSGTTLTALAGAATLHFSATTTGTIETTFSCTF